MPTKNLNPARQRLHHLFFGVLVGLFVGTSSAQEIGTVTYVQGVTSAQQSGGEQRFVGKGDALSKGETIHTGERGYAVVELKDGTKVTLRSNTEFAVNELRTEPGQESMVLNLLRGGLRVFTGFISKSRPDAAKLSVPTATIGIRGTEFDARLCGGECRREAQYARPVQAQIDPVVARVALIEGEVIANSAKGAKRNLARGAAIFSGDSVTTGAGAQLVMAFRDQTRVTLVENSQLDLSDVRTAGPQDSGNFVVKLLKGGLRAFTGLLGKADRSKVKFVTPTATIGIRGTGLDIRLQSDGTLLYTWNGTAAFETGNRELLVDTEQAGIFSADGQRLQLLPAVPLIFLEQTAIRPDKLDVNFDELFFVLNLDDIAPGLYVGVRQGNVNLSTLAGFAVDVGPFEAAFLPEGGNRPMLIEPLPGFLFNDPFPLPNAAILRPLRLIELLGPGRLAASNQCLLQ